MLSWRPMPLPDDAIVVRGGVGAPETIAVNAYTTFDTDGFWGVSGFSAAGLTVGEIAQLAYEQGRLPHPQIRTSTAGQVRDGGFEIEETSDDYPHVDILVPPEPDDEVWARLADLFDDPIPNPALPNQAEPE
jgi:hypothetical protein